MRLRRLRQVVIHQQQDVVAALAQRRDADLNDVEPVEQIFAEQSIGDALTQIAIRRGDQPHVGVTRGRVRADRLNLARLGETQQHRLHAQAHLPQFVEEERAAVGLPHQPELVLARRR